MRTYLGDGLIWAFSLIALAALAVSAPATYNLVAVYHNDGTQAGIVATVALLVILEAGAVVSKLATLWTRDGRGWLLGFCGAALSVNTLSNFIHGGLLASGRGLSWPAAWLGALVYAAFLPGLLYLMLHLICARVRSLQGLQRTVEDEVALVLQPVARAVETARQAQRALGQISAAPALLPDQVIYPRPQAVRVQPVLVPQIECPQCKQRATRMQLQTAPQHEGWRCSCGYKVPLVEIPHSSGLDSAL